MDVELMVTLPGDVFCYQGHPQGSIQFNIIGFTSTRKLPWEE
jgi:hypothetical protein